MCELTVPGKAVLVGRGSLPESTTRTRPPLDGQTLKAASLPILLRPQGGKNRVKLLPPCERLGSGRIVDPHNGGKNDGEPGATLLRESETAQLSAH